MRLILIALMFLLASCSSQVLVRIKSCEPVTGDFYKCEEVE